MKKIISIVISLILSISFIGCSNSQSNKTDTNTNVTSKAITLEQYSLIETGMTYEEVAETFEGQGKKTEESGFEKDSNYTITFTWWGEEKDSTAQLTFVNGSLVNKVEQNLK